MAPSVFGEEERLKRPPYRRELGDRPELGDRTEAQGQTGHSRLSRQPRERPRITLSRNCLPNYLLFHVGSHRQPKAHNDFLTHLGRPRLLIHILREAKVE
jgi:hypothetical protein